MSTMHAVVTDEDGRLGYTEVSRPEPLANEVLIRVEAAGVNPVDWKTRAGNSPPRRLFAPGQPVILGWDVAGKVEAAGAGVTRFAPGDRVFGMPKFPRPASAYAEYVVAGAREVARVPDGIDIVEAGALPLAGLTAWQALVDTQAVASGDRVLINAASGGVGHLAVQIAKAQGAEVWATASASKHDRLRELGADHLIDHSTERFEDQCSDMDAVLDLYAAHGSPTRAVAVLRAGGSLVTVSPAELPDAATLAAAEVSANWILVEPDYASLEAMAELMTSGALRVVIGAQRPLAQMQELHEIGQGGAPFGKLVATVG